ncbi:MAG: SPOR domain-containing protein [Ferruginibacter sp.]
MKTFLFFILMNGLLITATAQMNLPDSLGVVTVHKDPRIEILGKKMADYNESLADKLHSMRGYRLMLLSTNDRAKALQVRTQLLQYFPEQEVYMVFQSPFIKIKFGNFLEKSEAEDYRKQITSIGVVSGNIYVLPEMVEVKAEKIAQLQEAKLLESN